MTREKMNTKVRIVRCPNCSLLLAELPEISVYKCGGCGTVLQAKHSKPDMKEADDNHEANENAIKDADCDSNFTLLKKDATIDESSSPSTSTSDIIPDKNMILGQPQEIDNEDSSSSLEQKNPMEVEHDKDDSNLDSGQFETNDFPTSTELIFNEMEDCSIELQNILGTEIDTDQYTEEDETKRAKIKRDYFESSNFSDGVCSVVMLDSSPESKTNENKSLRKGVVLADTDISPDNQHEFEHLRAEDSPDHHLLVVESTSGQCVKNAAKDFTKSPTRSYYARDGGVSSSDGMDDRVPNRSSKPPRRKLKPLNGPLKRAESGLPGLLSSETEMDYHGYIKPGVNDDSESEIQHLSRKATFLEANTKDNLTRVHSNRYKRFDSGFYTQDTSLLYNVPDKLELLKMINKLKDELDRTRIANMSFPARFAAEDAIYAERTNRGQLENLPQRPRFSRMAYSGEATVYNHQANCTCLTQARHYSGGLPSYETTRCLAHNGQQFLQEHKTMSKNVSRIPTEKDRSSKRYLRPEAGGIPILLCYHCLELLQFPADFLSYGKKFHQLRCNTCRKIMKFSLENGRHLVPYTPNDITAPPPSMVDDYSQTSINHPNIRSNVNSNSFSEEYSISIDKSSSIKSERLARISHETHKHGNMNKRNLTFDQREMHTRHENSTVTVGSSGRRDDLKEVPSTSRGGAYRALHRLMGYSSPSQVIRR